MRGDGVLSSGWWRWYRCPAAVLKTHGAAQRRRWRGANNKWLDLRAMLRRAFHRVNVRCVSVPLDVRVCVCACLRVCVCVCCESACVFGLGV